MSKRLTTEQFIENARLIHGDKYDYSLTDYLDWKTKVIIICSIKNHGEFKQRPNNHTNNNGCPVCANINRPESYKSTIKSKNSFSYLIDKDVAGKIVPINKECYAVVDEEDFNKVMEYNWHLSGGKYAFNTKVGLMHRFIMGITNPNIYVDHKYHDCLDNRKEKLRLCTHQENCSSQQVQKNPKKSSKYKGVFWNKGRNKWESTIKHNQKKILIGRFDNEVDAARAYDKKAIELFKEFAYTNFKIEHYENNKKD